MLLTVAHSKSRVELLEFAVVVVVVIFGWSSLAVSGRPTSSQQYAAHYQLMDTLMDLFSISHVSYFGEGALDRIKICFV